MAALPCGGPLDLDGGMDCRLCAVAGDLWTRMAGSMGQIGAFSHESEHDLAVMVSDFVENGSGGAESRCSSDSESGLLSDLAHLSDKISCYKHKMDQCERDLLSTVDSLLCSINEVDLHFFNSSSCSASCIRFSLVKRLRIAGYDAAVCTCKWQKCGKVPGGDHEYIDVFIHRDGGSSERLIIDIDFRSHFEIARAVHSYDKLLSSLPVVFVGTLSKLKQFLQVMVEAARASLKQNSMPLPPWRSLAYVQAKWYSTYERKFIPDEGNTKDTATDHKQCIGHLKLLKSSFHSDTESGRMLKPINHDNSHRMKIERWKHAPFRAL